MWTIDSKICKSHNEISSWYNEQLARHSSDKFSIIGIETILNHGDATYIVWYRLLKDNYHNEFINKHLKDESYGSHREHMINAFNEGFSCGAAWMLELKEKN